jgi:signal transduction histidine kinase
MFHSARNKLTAWYVLIIMLISVSFSMVIFKGVSSEVERFARMQRARIEFRNREPVPPLIDAELVMETEQRFALILVIVNAGILLTAGGLAYMLAGRTLRPIQEMMEEQNRFITDASHELRTPLTSLKTAIEVHLRDKQLSVHDARELLENNIEDVNKLQLLSDALLQLAQYERPSGHTHFEKVVLTTVIKKAIKQVQPIAKAKDIRMTFENESTPEDEHVVGNPYGLHDLFVILLDNAVKYSPEKSTVSLKLSSIGSVEKMLEVVVKDEGSGISEKDLPHIFQRFYRADTARSKDSVGGYGLGLSIAKKIVAVHGGTMTVESEVGQGTTFTVQLPRK